VGLFEIARLVRHDDVGVEDLEGAATEVRFPMP